MIAWFGDRWTVRNLFIDGWTPGQAGRAIGWVGDDTQIIDSTIDRPGNRTPAQWVVAGQIDPNDWASGRAAVVMAGGNGFVAVNNDILGGDDAIALVANTTGTFFNIDIENAEIFHNRLTSVHARMFAAGTWAPALSNRVENVRVFDAWGWSGGEAQIIALMNESTSAAAPPALALNRNITISHVEGYGRLDIPRAGSQIRIGVRLISSGSGWFDNIKLSDCLFYSVDIRALHIDGLRSLNNNNGVSIDRCVFSAYATPDSTGALTADWAADFAPVPNNYIETATIYYGPVRRQCPITGCTSSDTTPPILSNVQVNGQPSGAVLLAGTTDATLSVTTDENATCKWSNTAGVSYASMPNTFTTTGGTSHSTNLTGLADGSNYTRYLRCQNTAGLANTSDYPILFSVSSTTLVGDLNGDRTVNGLDWTIMEGQWFTSNSQSDLNSDGIVNSIDFSLMNANWGRVI